MRAYVSYTIPKNKNNNNNNDRTRCPKGKDADEGSRLNAGRNDGGGGGPLKGTGGMVYLRIDARVYNIMLRKVPAIVLITCECRRKRFARPRRSLI